MGFLTVKLDEIAHILKCGRVIDKSEGWENLRRPTAEQWTLTCGKTLYFDSHIWTWESEVQNLDSPSTDMYEAITGQKLFCESRWSLNSWDERMRSVQANGGPVLLWADPEASRGSGVSPLDGDAYPDASCNGLLVPFTGRREVHDESGPVTLPRCSSSSCVSGRIAPDPPGSASAPPRPPPVASRTPRSLPPCPGARCCASPHSLQASSHRSRSFVPATASPPPVAPAPR